MICDLVNTVDSSHGMKRKKARTASDPELDKAVYSWFVKVRQAGTPIIGPVVSVQAQKYHNQLHVHNPGERTFICVHAPMKVQLLAHIFATFI